MSAIRITGQSLRESVAAVEAIDPVAARVGRSDRYRLASVAAADVLRVIDAKGELTDAALRVLRTRLADAGLYRRGVTPPV